jgi:hypothetical protein
MEAAARWDCWQGLDVSTFNLAGPFSDFSLSNYRACIWTEGYATATARLKVNDRHAQVIWVHQHFHLKVDAM